MSQQVIGPDDRRSLQTRLTVLQYSFAAVFSLLAIAFWVFQVAQHAYFKEIADSQYIQRVPLPAPRGVLFDRDGTVLVENQDKVNIVLLRERAKDIDATLRLLAETTGADFAELQEKVNRRRGEPSYRPIVLIENASMAQEAAVRARSLELPGIEAQGVPTRRYEGAMAAHLFGYVGEVSETQLQRAEYSDLNAGAIIGQAGLEQSYNQLLMGSEGIREVIVNSRGRQIEVFHEDPPTEGTPMMLTIDADLQKAAEDGFRHQETNGAAVVLDPRSGEVLTLLSLPSYDPNKFAVGMDLATWRNLTSDPYLPLQNRALQGTYSPGSTFKIVVAAAAMEEGIATPDYRVYCGGGATFYGRYFQCHRRGGHGWVDMRHAIEQSCNVYFYTLGQMLGVDRIHKWATALGLGQRTGIDIPNEASGLVPSTEWKQRTLKQPWYPGETISVAIGQGQVNVTPLSLAVMMATVANGGTLYTPHVLKALDRGHGWEPVPPAEPRSNARMKPSTVEALRDGLWMVVNGGGTGRGAMLPGRDVAGKTGTAQVISLGKAEAARSKMDVRHHRWFVFFAPRDNPEIAGVVFAEHAGSISKAVPIAKHIIETYFAKKEGQPLPVLEPANAPRNVIAAVEPSAAGDGRPGGTN